ncbi:MAG: type II secretion system F family protein [Candidatus Omnitrophica bacterium]|nr:type II secretion system F family protein [Candidatus Omnitrophota bacterium]
MALYRYKAKETPQKLVEGNIEAATRDDAIKQIEQMGYFPVKVEEISEGDATLVFKKVRTSRISSKEITIFSRQLATLIKSGVPILKALGVLVEQTSNMGFKNIISDVFNELKEGSKFSSCLSKYPKVFSTFYVAMVRAGEDSGNLEEVLFSLADYRTSQEDMVSKVKLALLYPVIMLFVGIGTIVFMLTFVMPRLMRIFEDMGEQLPVPTKILISVSQFLSQNWIFILVGLGAFIAVLRFELRRKQARRIASNIKLRLPLVGSLLIKKELARLSRTLELLIKSGIPILKAIELTAPIIDNDIIREGFMESHKELAQGSSLGKTLKRCKVFPAFMTNLISIGEESGKLDLSLAELANSYEKDTQDSIKAFTTILEPIMILGMGLIIGFVVIGMLLPIFQINLAIG